MIFQPPPLLVVLSGPSGVGKDAMIASMKEKGEERYFVVTITTRPQRWGEREGMDYYFVSLHRFQEMQQQGELLEHAQVYGHWYGVPKGQVREALAKGRDVIVKVDVQGAATIKSLTPEAVFIFIAPPSREELAARLKGRMTESRDDLDVRLKTAEKELTYLSIFDYVVINEEGKMEEAVARIESIIMAEKCRVKPRVVTI
ncbi:MAG: guanylate kinase [Chloroflexi bacterium]|nr:guanylate kinase [Chloroflexota bacterium]